MFICTKRSAMSRMEVSYMHGRGLIFDAEDYLKLRFEWRIVGNLIGVPVSHPRNVNQQGMPVVLSRWELKLLLDNQIIYLANQNNTLQRAPSDAESHLYASMVERQKEELRMPVIEKRLEAFQKHLPTIIEGKRKKMLKTGVKEENIHLDAKQLVNEERERLMKEKFDALVQIPIKYPLALESSLDLSPDERVKYRIFESLWKQGGFITTGDAFGSDFLLYPGDPMYFHASHMVHVLKDGMSQTLDTKYLIRVSRLAVVVNKLCVFAYIDESTDEVHFETLEWEGNVSNKSDTV